MKSFKQIDEGRPSQRHPLEGHEYHKKSNEALVGIAKDAHKAAEAMKSHNTTAENKYRDQANDSATVRYFRQKNGMPDWYKKKYGHVKEEVEQVDENSDEAYNHYKKQVLPIHKKHGLSPEFAKAVNNHVAKHGSYQVWNHHGDADGQNPHWFDSEKQKVKPIKQKRGYEVSEEVEQIDELSKGTLKNYVKKAGKSAEYHSFEPSVTHPKSGHKYRPTYTKRVKGINLANNKIKKIKQGMKEEVVDEAKEKTEYDYEGDMARGQLQSIISNAQRVHDMLEDNDNIAEWVQSKITLAEDYISTVANYMMSEVDEQFNPTRHTVEKDSPPSKDKVASANKQYADMAAARKKKLPQGADFAAQRRKERLASNGRMDEEVEPPFTPNKPKTSALPGKSGKGYSTARHLARMAMQKQVDKLKKPVKESIEESRKAQIVKDIVKKKKAASEDTFQKDPELSSSLTKTE